MLSVMMLIKLRRLIACLKSALYKKLSLERAIADLLFPIAGEQIHLLQSDQCFGSDIAFIAKSEFLHHKLP